MSIRTKIQWCDSTVTPTMGCDGCEFWGTTHRTCYAGVLHTRFGGATLGYAPTFEDLTLFPGRTTAAARWSDLAGVRRMDKPWLDNLPRRIFVSDMSDSLSRCALRIPARGDREAGIRWSWASSRLAVADKKTEGNGEVRIVAY